MSDRKLLLESELNELELILSQIPEDNVIERMSFESRLSAVSEELSLLGDAKEGTKVTLTFRGKPVLGSHGIAADFAAKATSSFSDAFVAVAAALGQSLNDIGPIPQRGKNQLLITGTAVGSFGFQFELPADNDQDELELGQGRAEYAMSKVEALLRLAAEGSDDDVAEIIDEVHPRAVRKVHDFLNTLSQQQAWCSFEFGGQKFCFRDYEQLKSSAERLNDENIKESHTQLEGQFVGILPAGRSFEFKISGTGEIVRGKIATTINDPDEINQSWLYKSVRVDLDVIQVGQGRPRHTLSTLHNIQLR